MSCTNVISMAQSIGTKDRELSGWCNVESGELVSGVIVKPGMQVVDVGCGDGRYVQFYTQMGADITVIDILEEKVNGLVNQLSDTAGVKIEGIVSDCDPVPLPDNYADLVVCTEVLEHVKNPTAFLQELTRIGGPNAYFVLAVPDARSERLVEDLIYPSYFEEPNHIHIFTAEDFQALVLGCGLEIISREFVGAFWSLFYLLKWATAEAGEKMVDNVHPTTQLWTQTWEAVLDHPNGEKMRAALNNALPKSQVIVARKQGAATEI